MDYKELASQLQNYLFLTISKSLKGLPNYGSIRGGLSRSGQPNEIGFEHLASIGVDVIIKLDRDEEYSLKKERELFKGSVIDKPLNLNTITKGDALRIASQVENKLKEGKKVHVHCKYGKDRTGLVIGTWKIKYKNTSFDEIKKDWKTYGTPAPKVQNILKDMAGIK
jgi:protein tyrosine/serine phosphatase